MNNDYYVILKERDDMTDMTKIANGLHALTEQAHTNAVNHGFYNEHMALIQFLMDNEMHQMAKAAGRDFILAQLMKTCGEAGEAVDAIQRNLADAAFAEEIADIIIRAADLCGYLRIDLGAAVVAKMQKNADRPYLHGKVC